VAFLIPPIALPAKENKMKKIIIIDTEIYSNYFLFAAKCVVTGYVVHLELHEDQELDKAKLHNIMLKNTTISFNGNKFDMPIIVAALNGWDNTKIKTLCDSIIGSNSPAYRTYKENNLLTPRNYDHIDLIEVAPGQASLKIYGGRFNSKRLQDLPIEPSALITPEQRSDLRNYCENDLVTTQELYTELLPQLTLRVSMSDQYGLDLRSKSDAQIAEAVISSELEKITGNKPTRPNVLDDAKFFYQNPEIVSFQSPQLKSILKRILREPFELGINGALTLPEWLKKEDIRINGRKYQMGIGGLHSCEKSQYIEARKGWFLCDLDVASYYPSIILQQQLAPKNMGRPFLKLYKKIVTERLNAKKSGDKVTADTLKIVLNGSFGKLGSKYSILYAPELLLQTTITGQLCLLMLIEAMEDAGITVMSANTDGIVCNAPKASLDKMHEIAFNWELATGYVLEQTDYTTLASRDVNNYIAVKTDGKIKGKGVFANTGLSKNPDCPIVKRAVAYCVAKDIPVEQTIKECTDIREFITVRKVTGGAVWEGEYLGKAVRYYYSSEVNPETCIHYAKNSNRVPVSGGARPLMDLPDTLPTDIDYKVYIDNANKLLDEVGYVRENNRGCAC
jgi:DNA polymerase elongation subunit (family B)